MGLLGLSWPLLSALETLSWRLFWIFFVFFLKLRFGFEKTYKKALKIVDFEVKNRARIVTKSDQKSMLKSMSILI